MNLQEQLAEEQRQRAMARAADKGDQIFVERKDESEKKSIVIPPVVPIVVTPQQRLGDAEATLKAFKAESELDSIKAGFAGLKVREANLKDGEALIASTKEQLVKDREIFETEQKKRVAELNQKVSDFNEAYDLQKTQSKEANRIMNEALKIKAEASRIVKNQTTAEAQEQAKQEAYTLNMTDAIQTLDGIGVVLRQNTDLYNFGITISRDLLLIKKMQDLDAKLSSLAEVIRADCARLTELCGTLQAAKADDEFVNKLLAHIGYIENLLKIEWTPSKEQGFKI